MCTSPAIPSMRQSSESRSRVAQQPASSSPRRSSPSLAARPHAARPAHSHTETALLERLGHLIALVDVAVRCPALPLADVAPERGKHFPRALPRALTLEPVSCLARSNQLKQQPAACCSSPQLEAHPATRPPRLDPLLDALQRSRARSQRSISLPLAPHSNERGKGCLHGALK